MSKQLIDTTKEIKFYVSRVITVGALIFSLIVGFISTVSISIYNYHSIQLDLAILIAVLLVSIGGVVWSVYIIFFDSLLLTVNEEGMLSSSIGNSPWSSIKGMYTFDPSFWDAEREPPFIRIEFFDGTSLKLSTRLFSVSPYDLLEILRTYHGSMPPGTSRASLLN